MTLTEIDPTETDPTEQTTSTDSPQPHHPLHPGSFAELGVQDVFCQALADTGITAPFPIQALTIPVALSGHDIIGQAKTGTGKTLGFGLPVLQQVLTSLADQPRVEGSNRPPRALVVTPTRELAVQVARDMQTAATKTGIRITALYGGRAYEPQIEALTAGVDVVVGTPGRMLDLAQQRHLHLADARIVVLDEADEMLDLGFLPDVEKLLGLTPEGRQTLLFSATMPGAIVTLARRYMIQPTHIRATDPDDDGATVKATKQFAYRAHSLDKVEMLARVLQAKNRGLTIIFARTKRTAAKVAEELTARGFAAAAIHGDLGQGAREQALRAFRGGKVDVLVATDVAARGIDIDDVTHVINYQCPDDEKTYVHRIGRTGRAGNSGIAVTFVDWDELTRWSFIDKALDLAMGDPVETYSSSPNLYEDLDIPAGTTGTLPTAQRNRAGLAAEHIEDLGGPENRRGPRGPRDKKPSRDTKSDSSRRRSSGSGQRRRSRGGSRDQSADQANSTQDWQTPSRTRRRSSGTRREAAAEGAAANAPAAPRRRRRRRADKSDQ